MCEGGCVCEGGCMCVRECVCEGGCACVHTERERSRALKIYYICFMVQCSNFRNMKRIEVSHLKR